MIPQHPTDPMVRSILNPLLLALNLRRRSSRLPPIQVQMVTPPKVHRSLGLLVYLRPGLSYLGRGSQF